MGNQDTTPIQNSRSQDVALAVVLERLKGIEAKCDRCIEQNDDITRQVSKIDTDIALGNQRMKNHEDRMDAIDTHLEATDTRVGSVEGDRKAVAGLWGGIIALLTAIGSYFK